MCRSRFTTAWVCTWHNWITPLPSKFVWPPSNEAWCSENPRKAGYPARPLDRSRANVKCLLLHMRHSWCPERHADNKEGKRKGKSKDYKIPSVDQAECMDFPVPGKRTILLLKRKTQGQKQGLQDPLCWPGRMYGFSCPWQENYSLIKARRE